MHIDIYPNLEVTDFRQEHKHSFKHRDLLRNKYIVTSSTPML